MDLKEKHFLNMITIESDSGPRVATEEINANRQLAKIEFRYNFYFFFCNF